MTKVTKQPLLSESEVIAKQAVFSKLKHKLNTNLRFIFQDFKAHFSDPDARELIGELETEYISINEKKVRQFQKLIDEQIENLKRYDNAGY